MATVKELQEQARQLDIEGRSSMTKPELEEAIAKAVKSAAPKPEAKPEPEAKPRKAKASPLAWLGEITPTHTGRPVLVAQALLREHGYQVGALDGIAGREFTRAVERFRSEHGLPAGDRIDEAVWSALAARP